MKKTAFICITILLGLNLLAQTPIKDQPGQTYFDMLEKIIVEKTMSEMNLLTAKPAPLPENFMDTLKKYDWVYLGGYFYTEKKFTDYKNLYKEYKIMRFDENGGKLEFSINGYQNFIINHLNFKNPPYSHWSVEKVNNAFYFLNKTPSEKGYQKILSYNNGTFIYLVTKSGKTTDNVVYFRECYTSVPKMFSWSFGE
jgi:hypothetical protein